MVIERIAVVGLGLMGGSLALALRPHVTHLSVIDTNPKTLEASLSMADRVTNDLSAGVREAELVILAAPVQTIIQLVRQLPEVLPEGCMILDLGSTKQEICRVMGELPASFSALGGHPMCGKEVSGFESADPDLFRGSTFVLSRTRRSSAAIEQVALEIVDKIGASPLFLAPKTHDEIVAITSHLPYLIASLLMHTASARQDSLMWQVSASGFRDTVRLSGSEPGMMKDIVLTNKTAILDELRRYLGYLVSLKELLESEDEHQLEAWLQDVKAQYGHYRRQLE